MTDNTGFGMSKMEWPENKNNGQNRMLYVKDWMTGNDNDEQNRILNVRDCKVAHPPPNDSFAQPYFCIVPRYYYRVPQLIVAIFTQKRAGNLNVGETG